MEKVVINAREYAWGDISVVLFGQPVGGCKSIKYTLKKVKNLLFGAGRHSRGIQHGKREGSGTIKILQSELTALNRTARLRGFKDILDVDFDIIIAYELDGIVITDKVCMASISELPAGMDEGADSAEIDLPFVCMDIQYSI